MPRPITATIHIAAMQHNLALARSLVPTSKIWAVAKANGYGHGLARVMQGFAAADGLAVIETNAAVKLREMGWKKPILMLKGPFDAADLRAVLAHRCHMVIHCSEQIAMLEQLAGDVQTEVYLKMNTGMNRLGFPVRTMLNAHARLRAIPAVNTITLMTHCANSAAMDGIAPGISIAEQIRRFTSVHQQLGGEHCVSDSAMMQMWRETDSDWVRPGTMLYGATVIAGKCGPDFGLLPAMTLESEIIGMQQLAVGDSVGYGGQFIADKPMQIGVVACGYADGYPRSASNATPILVDGVKTHVVGRVSMDSITVDLTWVRTAKVGSKVTLWGKGLPIEEVASSAGTIACDLMCGLGENVRVEEDYADYADSEMAKNEQ